MANTIIKQTNQGIVLEETPVTLSDEKLQSILLRTYEKANSDATKWHWYKLYGVFLSVAGTLFLTIMTSSFNKIGDIEPNIVKCCVIIITIIAAVLGFVFLGVSVNRKKKNDTETRDASIQEIMEKYYLHNQ